MSKFVNPTYKGKKAEKKVIDAACKGKLTAYIKHSPTDAMIPVKMDAVQRLREGQTLSIEEAEKTHGRFYFRLPSLAIRWGMENAECLVKLMEFEVPCFFLIPMKFQINGNNAAIGKDNVCIFEEYVYALEKKVFKKIKNVQPEFI